MSYRLSTSHELRSARGRLSTAVHKCRMDPSEANLGHLRRKHREFYEQKVVDLRRRANGAERWQATGLRDEADALEKKLADPEAVEADLQVLLAGRYRPLGVSSHTKLDEVNRLRRRLARLEAELDAENSPQAP